MKIPYNEEIRPDTGLFNAKLGIWLFLASEVMLFGALFSAYIMLRISDPSWHSYTLDAHTGKQILNIPLATLNTVILISSSVTMVMSWVSLKMKDFSKYKIYMGLTLLCSFGFLIIKYIEYSAKFEHGLSPATNNFMAIYFTLTGLHGLHVIGGIFVNFYLWKCFKETSMEKYSKWFIGLALLFLFLSFDSKDQDSLTVQVSCLILFIIIYGLSIILAKIKDFKSYSILTIIGFALGVYLFPTFSANFGFYLLFCIFAFSAAFDGILNSFKPKATFEDSEERFTNRIEVAGLYWHFVDLVWIFLFPALYLL